MTAPIREAVARAICKTRGIDPDDALPEEIREGSGPWPFWHAFTREADAALAVALPGEPVAWRYELSTAKNSEGEYVRWSTRITETKPNVPDGSIRNLTPLYAAIRADEGPK